MHILFINPWTGRSRSSNLFNSLKIPGVSGGDDLICRSLAAAIPKNHTITFVDELVEDIDFDLDADLVAITTFTRVANRTYEIADEFRKRGKKVVMGGWHVTALPDEGIQHADSIVIGEGEYTFPQLIKDLENDKLKQFYEQEEPVDLDSIPLLSKEEFNKYGSGSFLKNIQVSKGCPVGCEFCSISNRKNGHIHRKRSIENVMQEIKNISQKMIGFADPSLTINPKYTKELFKEMKGLNKKFSAEGNANVLAKDDELLKLASEAGCTGWGIGFESVNQESLNGIGKTTNKVEDYQTAIKKIHDHGMRVEGAFVFGFDTDKPDVFDYTIDTIKDWDIDLIDINTLTPYPGTPLYDRLEKENRILTKDWSKYDTIQVVYQPKLMTPDQLADGVVKVWREFYTKKMTFKRTIKGLNWGFNVFLGSVYRNYLYYNRAKKRTQ
ncbi:MAG: radical SAM protein [Thermoplasmatales archaeon]|nr:radical SAM protein [Thermoplasmatales archaeon]